MNYLFFQISCVNGCTWSFHEFSPVTGEGRGVRMTITGMRGVISEQSATMTYTMGQDQEARWLFAKEEDRGRGPEFLCQRLESHLF